VPPSGRPFTQANIGNAIWRDSLTVLAVLEEEFRERCHASYGFRFLHVIACLLLDGHNAPNKKESRWSNIVTKHGKRFANDVALDYPPELFESHKITSTAELVDRLERFSKKYSWNHVAPEMDAWQRETINSVAHSPAPFTARVAAIFNHPCFRRLKSEPQLGWIREVFPGATHDRWAHSLGVFSALVTYFQSLLADSEVPTFRLLVNEKDLDHAFVAAILHDLGQTAFGHDMEEGCRFIYSHDDYVEDLLDEDHWGPPTLRDAIRQHWPDVDISRVLSILRPAIDEGHKSGVTKTHLAIDGVSSDVISGPIDADKLDYLLRDSIACGVPYGLGIDVSRFLRCLTVTAKSMRDGTPRLALAYKAKGRAAILSVLIARYQMWGAVYWHHTFRCIQAMFVHSAAATLDREWRGQRKFGEAKLRVEDVRQLFYWRVIVGKTWNACVGKLPAAKGLRDSQEPPSAVQEERVLDLLWRLASPGIRELIEMLASRTLYKRVFEMRLGEMGPRADYSAMKSAMTPAERAKKAKTLQQRLLDTVDTSMRERGPSESIAEETARTVLADLRKREIPLVLLDFPVRGISDDRNTPFELGDAVR
jgi:HD superfamily phosphohydrolase